MRIVRSEEVAEITLLLPVCSARTEALAALNAAFRLHVGGVTIDLLARTAACGDRRLPLTPREFALLASLARQAGAGVTRAMLLAEIWGIPAAGSNFVEVHLSRLRAKLRDARAGLRIETLGAGGWRLVVG